MTQEDKQLLLADLCARLPYNVKANSRDGKKTITITAIAIANFMNGAIDIIKPYLRPMSSMTKDELKVFLSLSQQGCSITSMVAKFDFLNKNMFDYRGLISLDLALVAPKGMYELKLLDYCLPSQNEFDSVIDNTT